MEWVETTGKTLEEAKEAALDELGVHEDEAEFEVVEEEKTGLFGRVRREARVRARVRPAQARPKVERRRGRGTGRRGQGGRGSRQSGGREGGKQSGKQSGGKQGGRQSGGRGGGKQSGGPRAKQSGDRSQARARSGPHETAADDTPPADNQNERATTRSSRPSSRSESGAAGATGSKQEERAMSDVVSLQQQGEVVEQFLEGLLDAFDVDGSVSQVEIDDETLEVRVEGEDLGLLIGPRGNTLQAIQELARAAAQRQADGALEGRLRIDIAGYRERRRAALEGFAREQAEGVLADGQERALEPMSPPDRKVIHDTVNEIEGVNTISEGEEPRRRVIIVPAD